MSVVGDGGNYVDIDIPNADHRLLNHQMTPLPSLILADASPGGLATLACLQGQRPVAGSPGGDQAKHGGTADALVSRFRVSPTQV